MKTAIVCEGGGMRGVFTAGVLQAFMDENYLADSFYGVSAGASNGASYISSQSGRGYRTNVNYAGDKRYISKRNYLKTGSIFGMDFVFGELPEKLDPFDYAAFHSSKCSYFFGATDLATGKIKYFGKEDITPGLTALRASCSLPVFSKIVDYKGGKYLDGGVADPIPLAKALEDGAERIIVVLTRERGYKKTPQSFKSVYKRIYKAYPNFVKALEERHLIYNNTLVQVEKLEAEGKVVVIAPPQPLEVDRFGKDKQKLIAAYNVGHSCGLEALKKL